MKRGEKGSNSVSINPCFEMADAALHHF